MPQTTFLGATVKQATMSATWGIGSPSQLSVSLVVDPANGDVYDPPEVGTPVYFQMGNLTFGGLLQSEGESKDAGGYPAYEVTVQDPREILDGAQLVLGGYSGTTNSVPNLLNPYGWWEAQGFGLANSDDRGMPWSKVQIALEAICNQPEQTDYGGPLLYRGYRYGLDFSQLPSVPSDYRVGSNLAVSLLELIALICEDAGHDFMVELVGSTIRLRTQSRQNQPDTAYLEGLKQTYAAQGVLIRSRVGREARNEITSSFLFGGDRRIVHESDSIASFWGHDTAGNPILGIPSRIDLTDSRYKVFLEGGVKATDTVLVLYGFETTDTSCTWNEFTPPFDLLINTGAAGAPPEVIRVDELLDAPGGLQGRGRTVFRVTRGRYNTTPYLYQNTKLCFLSYGSRTTEDFTLNSSPVADISGQFQYPCTEFELRLARASYYAWAAYVQHFRPSIAARIGLISPLLNKKGIFEKLVINLINDLVGNAQALAATAVNSDQWAKSQRFYEWLKIYADEYLGRKYAVSLPLISYRRDADTLRVRTSYEIDEGGWLPDTLVPLGLAQLNKDTFSLQDGRYRAFCRFDNILGADFSHAAPDSTVIDGSQFWSSVSVDQNIIYTPSPAAVVSIDNPLFDQAQDNFGDSRIVGAVLQLGEAQAAKVMKSAAWGNLGVRISPAPRPPARIAVPLRSNTETYGPWYGVGAQGRVKIEQDQNMVPWSFGSDELMNAAGDARVVQATTQATVVEAGSFELAGTPLVSLGEALQENGPVVTAIQITAGADGWRTTYNFQTFTPRFGVFARDQQERLRRIALAQSQLRRAVRANAKGALAQAAQAKDAARVNKEFMQGAPKAVKKQSPHDVLVAQTYADDLAGEVRTGVSVMTLEEAVGGVNVDDADTYQRSAAMSLGGLLRPLSTKTGSTSMSSYAAHQAAFSGGIARTALDPWKSATTDIEVWTHDSSYWGMHARRWGGNNDEARVIGLRGPVIVAGFGYSTDGVPVPGDGAGGFRSDHLTNPVNWKAGPVDSIWDERRGVWTSHDICKGTARAAIPASLGGSGCVQVTKDGADTDWTVWAFNWSASSISSGTACHLLFNAWDNKWYAQSTAVGGAANPPTPTGLFTFHQPEFDTGGGQPSLISAKWGVLPQPVGNVGASGSSYLFSMSDHVHAHGVFPTGNLHPEYNLPTGVPYSVLAWNAGNQKEWQRDPTLSGVYLGGAGIGCVGHLHLLNALGSGMTVRCGQSAGDLQTLYLPDNTPASGHVLGVVTHVAGGIVTQWIPKSESAYRYQFHQPEFVVASGDPTTVQANWGTSAQPIATAGAAGTAELFSRSDHVHAHPVLGGDLHPEYNLPTGVPYTALCLNGGGQRTWERVPHLSGVVVGGSGLGATGFVQFGNPLGSGFKVMADAPDRLWHLYLPNNVPVSGQMLTVIQATGDVLRTAWETPPSGGGGSATLPYTRVGFGDATNVMTSSANLTYSDSETFLSVLPGTLGGGYRAYQYGTLVTGGPAFVGMRARGTSGSPTDTQAGDHLARFGGIRYSSPSYWPAAYLDIFAAGSSTHGSGVFKSAALGTETEIFSWDGTTGKSKAHSLTAARVVGTDANGYFTSLGAGASGSFLGTDGSAYSWLGFSALGTADIALTSVVPHDTSGNKQTTYDRFFGFATRAVCDGRLTLTSGTSVTRTDVTGAGTLYFAPHVGTRIALYDGTRWKLYTFAELSLSLSVSSGSNYDVFIYDNAGTLTLELSAAWSGDTTRTDALARQDGVLVKSGATTRRWLGIIRGSASNQTEDSLTKRFVCNAYNAVPRGLLAQPGYNNDNAVTSFTTTSTTYERANGGTGSRIECLSTGEQAVQVVANATASIIGGTHQFRMGIGPDDSTTPFAVATFGGLAGMIGNISANYCKTVAAGYHYFDMLVLSTTGTSVSIFSDINRAGGGADPNSTYIGGHCAG